MKSYISILVLTLLVVALVSNLPLAISRVEEPTSFSAQPLPGYIYRGQAPEELSILVSIAVPLRNIDTLGSAVKQASDPSSPFFRHFYTPAEIKQKFLPTSEHELLLAKLQNAGLEVVSDSLDSMVVVKATVAQVKTCFNANVDIYTNGADAYYITSGNSIFEGARFVASNVSSLLFKPQLAATTRPPSALNLTYTSEGFSAKTLQTVYNATTLYAQGFNGENQVIGVLDFYGSPTIQQDLARFSDLYNFSDAHLTIIPIGPYAPNLGVVSGWSSETALDVESAHAMAPEAAIHLYVGSGVLSLADALAPIVQRAEVSTLSMSFGTSESMFSSLGPEFFYFNIILPDQFFMIGSLEGITFLAASGDGGGSGSSAGTAGNVIYPSSSPYVTSVGGTQTYFYSQPDGTLSWVQTAWSNHGWVPYKANYGGSGGGVSFVEPKPWYQQRQEAPPSYPNGRLSPDLALQAGVYPGVFFVDAGATGISGGTSLSAPLLAGLLSLVAQSSGSPLGLVNPFLYTVGNDVDMYSNAYEPISFGYAVPWTATYGYNLVTGWGAPNIGKIADVYRNQVSLPNLNVLVTTANENLQYVYEFTQGQNIEIFADIFNGNKPVTNGTFTAKLTTLAGTSLTTPMTFNSTFRAWTCTLTMGNQSGLAYVEVNGTSGTVIGEGFTQIFAGYFATFHSPDPMDPWTTAGNSLQVVVESTDLYGNPAPLATLSLQVQEYSILDNTFANLDTISLQPNFYKGLGIVNAANLTKPYSAGPVILMMQGSTWGFLPYINGINLQNSKIYTEVYATPGVAAPGQSLVIESSPIAPLNVANVSSLETGHTVSTDIAQGADVVALLVDPSGNVVASTDLALQASTLTQLGSLKVPLNTTTGLYTVMLIAGYESFTLSCTLYGSFYSQIWVAEGAITPKITLLPPSLYMGQTAQVIADIRYPSGQEATYGQFTAAIYPQNLRNAYAAVTYAGFSTSQLTVLSYDSTLNRWTGNMTLPSPYNLGAMTFINGNTFDFVGPYEAYVTGITFDGVPTTIDISAEQGFFIQPYVYVADQKITSLSQSWGLALSGNTIEGSATLSNNVFLGENYLQGGETIISNSVIEGTLTVAGCNLTLQGIHGGSIVAANSSLRLVNSNLDSITLSSSQISTSASSYGTIAPLPPTIQFLSPTNGASYQGDLTAAITVTGSDVNSVTTYLNGVPFKTFVSNGTLAFTIPTRSYADGAYRLQVIANQSTGISSSAELIMYFTNQVGNAQSSMNLLNESQKIMQNQLNNIGNNISRLTSGQEALANQIGSLNTSQSAISGQLGSALNDLNILNSTQATIGDQASGLLANLNELNSSQAAFSSQMEELGNNLNSTLNALKIQVNGLRNNLNTAQNVAIAGIGLAAAATVVVVVVVAIVARKRTKSAVN